MIPTIQFICCPTRWMCVWAWKALGGSAILFLSYGCWQANESFKAIMENLMCWAAGSCFCGPTIWFLVELCGLATERPYLEKEDSTFRRPISLGINLNSYLMAMGTWVTLLHVVQLPSAGVGNDAACKAWPLYLLILVSFVQLKSVLFACFGGLNPLLRTYRRFFFHENV